MYTVGRGLSSRSSVVLRGDCEVVCRWYYIFHYHGILRDRDCGIILYPEISWARSRNHEHIRSTKAEQISKYVL